MVDRDRLAAMSAALASRGPDHAGVWVHKGVGLAHRRLSIVDLSESASQPMVWEDGRYVITFNGEIYNYQALRDELEQGGVRLHSTSDTEIIIALYAREGEKMLSRLRGMFALAIWDGPRQQLFFARDRIGKKPFFYTHEAGQFVFASEIKALLSEQSKPSIDLQAIRLFFGLQYVPSPWTGFMGIRCLPPAHYGFVQADGSVSLTRYESYERTGDFRGSYADAVEEVRRLVNESVRLRMIADVPVGTFLSGGIDSSIVATLMARNFDGPIQTFTMGFPTFGFDEREEARDLARRLGADHHEYEAQPGDIPALIDTLVSLYDAPFADASALPTWLLARATRQHVKAVMTGDGGDELFAGYRRYQAFLQAKKLRDHHLDGLAGMAAHLLSMGLRQPRYQRFARLLEAIRRSDGEGYASLFTGSYFSAPDEPALLQPDFCAATQASASEPFVRDHARGAGLSAALHFDLTSYLPDDLNVKMDRASMAHGLEARAPFLDQELVRFVMTLPLSLLLKERMPKPLLKAAFQDLLPKEVFRRPKRGFQVPLGQWFRRDLRGLYVERCLTSGVSIHQFCRPQEMERYLRENDRGLDQGNRLWMLLVLATWLEHYGKS